MNVYLELVPEPVPTPTTRFYSLFNIGTCLPALGTCRDRFFRATCPWVSLVFPTGFLFKGQVGTGFFKNKNTGIKRGVKRVKSVRLKQLRKTRPYLSHLSLLSLRIPRRGGGVGA